MNTMTIEQAVLSVVIVAVFGFFMFLVIPWLKRKKMNQEKVAMDILVICWLGLLLFAPLLIIASFHEQNAVGLGLGIGLTMFLYWVTGILTAMMKKWTLEGIKK